MKDIIFVKENGVATIKLNRPGHANAFSMEMIKSWISILEEVRDSNDIKVLVLTGVGKAFCAGGDITSMREGQGFIKQNSKEDSIDLNSLGLFRKNSLWKYIQRIPLLLQEIDIPVIAAMNGHAIGAGLDMALMCDVRFASKDAKFGTGYINMGLVPGDGSAYFLPRIIGVDKALDLLWTGDVISAEKAESIGLVTRIYNPQYLMEAVYNYCEKLVQQPQTALRMTKRSLLQSLEMNLKSSLDLVSSHMSIVTELEDYKEKINQK